MARAASFEHLIKISLLNIWGSLRELVLHVSENIQRGCVSSSDDITQPLWGLLRHARVELCNMRLISTLKTNREMGEGGQGWRGVIITAERQTDADTCAKVSGEQMISLWYNWIHHPAMKINVKLIKWLNDIWWNLKAVDQYQLTQARQTSCRDTSTLEGWQDEWACFPQS